MRRLLLPTLLLVAGCEDPAIVLPEVLTVLNVFPSHGAIDIGPDVEPFVFFSHPVDEPAAAAAALRLECLGAGACDAPDAAACGVSPTVSVSFKADAQSARLTPSAPLRIDTCWVVIVEAGIAAGDGDVGPLPVEMRSSFQTR